MHVPTHTQSYQYGGCLATRQDGGEKRMTNYNILIATHKSQSGQPKTTGHI